MTTITWKGEADGPPSCTWKGIAFPVGVAVEVADEWMIGKARGNRFFQVDDDPAKKPEPEQSLPIGLIRPEMWTNTPPPDYPPEDDPDRLPFKRKRGRPPKVRENGDGDQ